MKRIIAQVGLVMSVAGGVVAPASFAQADTAQADRNMVEQKPALLHDGLSSPVGMAYDSSANLYVANWSAGTVLKFAPDGRRSVFAEGLRGPSGLAISPAGDIFVASYSEDLVWRFTPGGERSVFVSELATPIASAAARRAPSSASGLREHIMKVG